MFKYSPKIKLFIKVLLKLFEFSFLIVMFVLNDKNLKVVELYSDYNYSYNFIETISLIMMIKNILIINFIFQFVNFIFIILYNIYLIITKSENNKFSIYFLFYLLFSDYIYTIFLFTYVVKCFTNYYKNSIQYEKYCEGECKYKKDYIINNEQYFNINLIFSSIICLFKFIDLGSELIKYKLIKKDYFKINKIGELELN